jgi:hypothetical protein
MKLDLNPTRLGDFAAALLALLARAYCLWALWSLWVAPQVPIFGVTYVVPYSTVVAALALLAAWRGLSLPGVGSWSGALQTAALYGALGFAAGQ